MNSTDLTAQQPPHRQENWTGYTLEDLRYRRAFIGARRELQRERLLHDLAGMRKGALSTVAGHAKKVSGTIPLLNSAMVAFTVGSRVWKIVRSLRGKKKKK